MNTNHHKVLINWRPFIDNSMKAAWLRSDSSLQANKVQ